jgi:hypothetical protein
MRRLVIEQLDYDLTPVAGIALVGHSLKSLDRQWKALNARHPFRRGGVAKSDVLRAYLRLLTQAKSDFDAIENFRADSFFKQALGIASMPSSPTLRQRLDARAADFFECLPPMIESLLAGQRPDYGLLPCGWLPLDIDTFAMGNGGTAKESVGRTYAGVDGYRPLAGLPRRSWLLPGIRAAPGHPAFGLRDRVHRTHRSVGPAPESGWPAGADLDTNHLVCQMRRWR